MNISYDSQQNLHRKIGTSFVEVVYGTYTILLVQKIFKKASFGEEQILFNFSFFEPALQVLHYEEIGAKEENLQQVL